MKRFILTAAVAASLGFVSAGKADAQIVYGYTAPAPGGIVTNRTVVGPLGGQSYSSYYSPWTGTVQQQVYGSNVFGGAYNRGYGYNPWTGAGYNYGNFVQPNVFSPWGGYNYGTYSFRRGW